MTAPAYGDLRSCPGKVRFATETAADDRAREINALTGDNMHAYSCTACGWIHLGHPDGATGIRHGKRRATAERPSAAERVPRPPVAARALATRTDTTGGT